MLRLALGIVALALVGALFVFFARVPAKLARRVWLVAFTLVLGSGITMMGAHAFVAKWGFRGDDIRDGLERMMDGTAYRPFVYRRLAPELVRIATDVSLARLPPRAIRYLAETSNLKRYRVDWNGIETWTTHKAVAFHIAYFLVWISLFGTLLAGAALIHSLRGSSAFESVTTASIAMCFVPLMFVGGGYLYDSTELFLWTALLVCAVRGWNVAVPVLFGLMLVNKESALIAVPALFAISYRRSGFRVAVAWAVGLGALGVAWLLFVRAHFAGVPGSTRESWLPTNLAFWSNPKSYFLVTQLYSPVLPAPRGANVLLLVLLFLPLRFGFPRARSDIRWATVLTALLLVPLFFTSCYMDEIRNLSLLFPLLYVVVVEGVHVLVDSESGDRTASGGAPRA